MKKKKQVKVNRPIQELSPRQAKILALICKELSPQEISLRLKISEKTFFNHRTVIVSKTKAKGNIGLFKYALLHGYAKLKGVKIIG